MITKENIYHGTARIWTDQGKLINWVCKHAWIRKVAHTILYHKQSLYKQRMHPGLDHSYIIFCSTTQPQKQKIAPRFSRLLCFLLLFIVVKKTIKPTLQTNLLFLQKLMSFRSGNIWSPTYLKKGINIVTDAVGFTEARRKGEVWQ